MYATDRGIEELESRRGEQEVTLAWLADRLRVFVDLNPEFEVPVERGKQLAKPLADRVLVANAEPTGERLDMSGLLAGYEYGARGERLLERRQWIEVVIIL